MDGQQKTGTINWFFLMAVALGLLTGLFNQFVFTLEVSSVVTGTASVISDIFIRLLKLVSLPIIFLSIVSTASGMKSLNEIRFLGTKVVKYTFLTTIIAASVALAIFVFIDPVNGSHFVTDIAQDMPKIQGSYWDYLLSSIPSNLIEPFSNNSVIGVLFLAMMLSFASLTLPAPQKKMLHEFFSSLYAALMKITLFIVSVMPIAVWAFVHLFYRDVQEGLPIKTLGWYLACVLLANAIQAIIVLPLMLKFKGISPLALFRGMYPALSLAFFSKSSSAALPMAIKCAQARANLSKKVSNFSLPLCTTINMNACAAFILTTVFFVSMSHGVTYTPIEMITWIFIATIAAVGNAGVPMGCFFLSQAFLAAMNVPLNILMVILPLYALIDMFESAINVWSDSCVAACVQKEIESKQVATALVDSLSPEIA